jgi:AcrR family transcriptional regulator
MRQTPERRQEVLETANRLIAEQGLARFSMLALAQALGMSKETLYAWFGSKEGLLQELIHANAGGAVEPLKEALAHPPSNAAALAVALEAFCLALLRLLMSERSVALNRGAVLLGPSSEFGGTLRAEGRDRALRALRDMLAGVQTHGLLAGDAPETMAEVLVALALRDWQIDRVLGRLGAVPEPQIKKRAAEAARLFMRLFGV